MGQFLFSFGHLCDTLYRIGEGSCEEKWSPRTAAGQITVQLVRRYYLHDVGRDSAALTYYLLFALFPLLVFISTLLGILKLDVDSVTRCCPRSFRRT